MNEFLSLIEESLKDDVLSSKEKTELRQELNTAHPTLEQRMRLLLRSIFLASQKSSPENHEEVMRWLGSISLVLGNYEDDPFHNNAFFSLTDDIRQKVLDGIKEASETIDVAMFTISDDDIAKALIRVFRKGISIRVLTDDEKIYDQGSDIRELKSAGIEVRIDSEKSLMHHKFMIVDSIRLYNGSYNWTRTGADKNNENLVITDNATIVKAFVTEYERLWPKMKKL